VLKKEDKNSPFFNDLDFFSRAYDYTPSPLPDGHFISPDQPLKLKAIRAFDKREAIEMIHDRVESFQEDVYL